MARLKDSWTARYLSEHSRKELAELLVVGQSTISTWLKQDAVPDTVEFAMQQFYLVAALRSNIETLKDALHTLTARKSLDC